MRAIAHLDIESDRPVLLLDIETTGRDPIEDRIVSLGACLFPTGLYGEEPHKRYEWFFNPAPVECKQEAYDVHGLGRDFLKRQDKFDQFNDAVKKIHSLMFHYPASGRSPIIIAHSAEFDLKFLKESFQRLSFWWPDDRITYYCTKTWAQHRGQESKLDQQLRFWSLPPRGKHHSAMEDAWFTSQVAFRQGLTDAQGYGTATARDLPPCFEQGSNGEPRGWDKVYTEREWAERREKHPVILPDESDDLFQQVQNLSSLVITMNQALKRVEREHGIRKNELDEMEDELPGATAQAMDLLAGLIEEREGTHGDFENNSEITKRVITALTEGRFKDAMTARETVAIFMVVHKLARFMSTPPDEQPHPDHLLDAMGYLYLAHQERNRT